MSIGSKIKEARIKLGMSQEKLAELAGVTKGAIGNYETDVSSPKEPILIKLMQILNVDANYIYQDYIKKPPEKNGTLSEGEEYLLELFRKISDDKKQLAIEMLKAALKAN